MANINSVVISGRITKDPELRMTTTGKPVMTFSLACNRYSKAGEEQKADFFNCQAWNKTAEFLAKYAKKGSQITIEGRLQSRSYDRTDGTKAYVTEILVRDVDLVFDNKQNGSFSDVTHAAVEKTAKSNYESNYYSPTVNTAWTNTYDANSLVGEGNGISIDADDLPF